MAYQQTLFIEREWQAGDDGSIPVINPVTGETVASISSASKARVDAALRQTETSQTE
jgi:acyl-CoA reductase-like NAD-dependent aldehyde dehydrogenase